MRKSLQDPPATSKVLLSLLSYSVYWIDSHFTARTASLFLVRHAMYVLSFMRHCISRRQPCRVCPWHCAVMGKHQAQLKCEACFTLDYWDRMLSPQ